jgi:hypothetical protein
MTKTKIKPPTETKAQLIEELTKAVNDRFDNRYSAAEYLLNFFTAVDLVGIRDDLKRLDNNGV